MALYLPSTIVLAAILTWIGVLNAHNNGISAITILVCFGAVAILFGARANAKWYLLAALPWLFTVYAKARMTTPDHADISHFVHSSVLFRAEVEEPPVRIGSTLQVVLVRPKELFRPKHMALSGRAQLLLRDDNCRIATGDTLEVKAQLEGIKDPPNPWSFQLKKYLGEKGIFCQCTVMKDNLRVFHSKGRETFATVYSTIIENVRKRIADFHNRTLGETYGSLLTSMVLGDKCIKVDQSLVDRFRRVGLSHLIAASGFNLTIVVGMSFWTIGLVTRSRTVRSVGTILAISLFVAIAGPSASVLRASVCSCLFLLCSQANRSFNPLAMLSLALLLTIIVDPSSVIEPGAELSYAATFGLILAAKNLSSIADFLRKDNSTNNLVLRKIRSAIYWLLETASVAISAQSSVLPIQLAYFWQVGAMFLPANIVVSPLVAPITVIGFVSSAIAALPLTETCGWLRFLCSGLDLLAFLPLKAINVSAEYLAQMPNAIISYGPPSTMAIFFYYCSFLGALVLLAKAKYKLWSALLFCIGLTVLLWRNELVGAQIDIGRESISFLGTDRRCECAVAGPNGPTAANGLLSAHDPAGAIKNIAAEKFAAYYGAILNSHRLSENAPDLVMLKNGKEKIEVIIFTANQIYANQLIRFALASDTATASTASATARMLVISESKSDHLKTRENPFAFYHRWRNQQTRVRTYLLWAKPSRNRPDGSRQSHCFVIGQYKPTFFVHVEPGMDAYLYTD